MSFSQLIGADLKADLNQEFRTLISLVCEAVGEFQAYDVRRIAISLSASKGTGKFGTWAYVVPLRYVGGGLERRGVRWGLPGSYRYESARIEEREPEARYLMTFLVPKFFRLSSEQRLETIVHELYHLHPTLRGDLRRFALPHLHHGPTPALYRAKVKSLAAEAARRFPELLEHRLLKGAPEDFADRRKIHLPIPRRVFRPFRGLFGSDSEPQGLSQAVPAAVSHVASKTPRGAGILLAFVLAALSTFAWEAQALRVVTIRKGAIYANPSAKSDKVDAFDKGQTFDALRLSRNRTWVEVQGQVARGWIPRRWVTATSALPASTLEEQIGEDSSGASARAATPLGASGPTIGEEGLPGSEDEDAQFKSGDYNAGLAEIDAAAETQRAGHSGKLFEKPNPLSERFGLVEKGDELKAQRKSAGGKWAYVRIQLTGEEGWYPLAWITTDKTERLQRFGPWSVEGFLAYGAGEYRLGFGAGLTYNLFPKGFGTRPRDRLEIGVLGTSFLGANIVEDTVSAPVSFIQAVVLGRYVAANLTGGMGLAGEAGIMWDQRSIDNSQFSKDVITQYDLNPGSSYGFLMGVTGLIAISEVFQLQTGLRLRVGGGFLAVAHGGAAFRF